MKTIRLLLLLLIAGIGFAGPAAASTPDERLIGTWEEYDPSSNVIQFFPAHTLKLYLTQEEGEESDSHYIGGTWSLSSGGILTMHMSLGSKEMTQTVKVVFRGDEMVMVGEDDSETIHRRLKGALPEKYVW